MSMVDTYQVQITTSYYHDGIQKCCQLIYMIKKNDGRLSFKSIPRRIKEQTVFLGGACNEIISYFIYMNGLKMIFFIYVYSFLVLIY